MEQMNEMMYGILSVISYFKYVQVILWMQVQLRIYTTIFKYHEHY